MAVPVWVWWVVGVSFVTFVVCVADKRQARARGGRVPERVLLGLALAGGSPGLLLGMAFARHKTRKLAFLVPFAAIVALQATLVWWLWFGPER